MRDEGAKDFEIIRVIGLKNKVPFKMNLYYLRKLFGFISSRQIEDKSDMYAKWLEYHKKNNKSGISLSMEKNMELSAY